MAKQKKAKLIYNVASLAISAGMLRKALSVEAGAFGRRPSYAPDVSHYQKTLEIMLAIAPADKLAEAKLLAACNGETYLLKKDNLAYHYLEVAENLIELN